MVNRRNYKPTILLKQGKNNTHTNQRNKRARSSSNSYASLCKRTKHRKNVKHTNQKAKRSNSMCNSYEPSTKRTKQSKQNILEKKESSDYDFSDMESVQAILDALRPLPVTSKIKTNEKTCSKTESDDSVQYKHIVIKPPSSGTLLSTNFKECGTKDIFHKKISELENKRIIQENKNDGSTTEISFKLGIVMHVKTTKATRSPSQNYNLESIQGQKQTELNLETHSNEIIEGSRTSQNYGSSSVHRLATFNSSQSVRNEFHLKSSQNDLDLRRQITTKMIENGLYNSHSPYFPDSPVSQVRTSTSSEASQHPKLNSLENSSLSASNILFEGESGTSLSHVPVFSSPLAKPYCKQTPQNTIVTQAEVHCTQSGHAVKTQPRSKTARTRNAAIGTK